jgi:hypothetical protein
MSKILFFIIVHPTSESTFYKVKSAKSAQAVTLLTYIVEVTSSNLGRDAH